jgi:hypothetical protein
MPATAPRHVPYPHEVDQVVSLELGGFQLDPKPVAGAVCRPVERPGQRRAGEQAARDGLRRRPVPARCPAAGSGRLGAYRRYVGETPPRASHARSKAKPTHTAAPSRACEPGYSPSPPVTVDDLNCADLSTSQKPHVRRVGGGRLSGSVGRDTPDVYALHLVRRQAAGGEGQVLGGLRVGRPRSPVGRLARCRPAPHSGSRGPGVRPRRRA